MLRVEMSAWQGRLQCGGADDVEGGFEGAEENDLKDE